MEDFNKEVTAPSDVAESVDETAMVATAPETAPADGLETSMTLEERVSSVPATAPEEADTAGDAKGKVSSVESVYELVDTLIGAILVFLVVFCFLFRLVSVDGDSMNDTLVDKDRLILQTAFYTPERGDVVVIYQESAPQQPLIKRVIAVGGDSLRLDVEKNTVYLKTAGTDTWQRLDEPYVNYPLGWGIYWSDTDEVTVPEGHLFVMGDHRNDSRDSRYESVGFVPVEDIIGHAVFRVAPLDSFGTI